MKLLTTAVTFVGMLCGTLVVPQALADDETAAGFPDYTFLDLALCTFTTLELAQLGGDESIEPCVLSDVQPTTTVPPTTNRSVLVTSVQVTPVGCAPHRDGAVTAANLLNADNDNQGVTIGFQQDYFVQFRHVSIIAGNPGALGTTEYNRRHMQLLESAVTELDAQYIVGTCSFASSIERESARLLKRIVLTQVGPPGFYRDAETGGVNPYVFGIHINSDTYGLPAIQQLAFLPNGPETIPIRIVYRKQSEFFYSTCQSIVDAARGFGFVDIETVLYEHDGDHDGDGTINQFDNNFLGLLADQICPPDTKDSNSGFHPAIFACTLSEQDVLLSKWRENGCQPYAMWMTPSTWEWALNNQEVVPYFQGGGQWHPAFSYGDKYFDTGADLLSYNEDIFGYRGSYDMVVSYAMVVLFAQHLQAAYRVLDEPDPETDFASDEGYERLRRDMIILNVETIFGTVSFNEFQRNVGRGAAGTQWLPVEVAASNGTNPSTDKNNEDDEPSVLGNFLVSPFLQAERAVVAPVPVAVPCDAGDFNNRTRTQDEESLLLEKCSTCALNTFTAAPNLQPQCQTCPAGSSTQFLEGQTFCTTVDDNLIGAGLKVLANFGVLCTWLFALYFASWTIRHRNDPVVKIGQTEFLLTICGAAMVSSASVIFLGFEAGSGQDGKWADLGCQIAPFLYAAGWVTEYSSLSVKTYRLFRITSSNNTFRRIQIHSYHMFFFVFLLVFIDMALLLCVTIFAPIDYVRDVTNRDVSDNIVTIKTSGGCSSDDNIWAFLGPLVALHASLQIGTNLLLFKVRRVTDRYQEQKYVALASLFVLEVLVIGIPVLVAVQDSPAARYIVMAAIVILNDIGILCFVFLPKMRYQKEGLPEGVGVGESINREGMRRAISRRSQSFSMPSQHGSRLAGRLAGTMGQSFSSDGSLSEKRVSNDDENHSNPSGSGTTKQMVADRRESKQWGFSFGRDKNSGKSAKLNDPAKQTWGSAVFKSSVGENLDSIVEAADETSNAFSANGSSTFKKETSVPTSGLEISRGSILKDNMSARSELVGNVKARVQEKLAKRLAMTEFKSPEVQVECALVDENTALAVGGSMSLNTSSSEAANAHGSGEFGSGEFESPSTQTRLMNRLGATSS